MASSLGALIGPLFSGEGATPAKAKKMPKLKKAKAAVVKATSEPAEYKPPSPEERMHNHAREAKVRATQNWVEGRMTTKEHDAVHKRAKHILASREPKSFKGKTGERKKGMMLL